MLVPTGRMVLLVRMVLSAVVLADDDIRDELERGRNNIHPCAWCQGISERKNTIRSKHRR